MLYGLKDYSGDPWNGFMYFFGRFRSKLEKTFRSQQKLTSGFIIAWWKDEGKNLPTHFLSSGFSVRKVEIYEEYWIRFGDDRKEEDPKQYKSLQTAFDTVGKLREHHKTKRIGLVFWTHPEFLGSPPKDCVLISEKKENFKWYFKIKTGWSAEFAEASSDEAHQKLNPVKGEKVFGHFISKEDAMEALSSHIDLYA